MDVKPACLALALATVGFWNPAVSTAHEDEDTRRCNPLLDSSGDAVMEADGDVVEHSGTTACPEVAAAVVVVEKEAAVEPEPVLVERTVYFPFDVADLTPEAEAEIEKTIADQTARQAKRVLVLGHTDRAGPADYNRQLSAERAASVEAALVAEGLPADSIAIEAMGETNPAVETGDGVALPANRRAVIALEY